MSDKLDYITREEFELFKKSVEESLTLLNENNDNFHKFLGNILNIMGNTDNKLKYIRSSKHCLACGGTGRMPRKVGGLRSTDQEDCEFCNETGTIGR